ncbi:MAG: phosphoenolpyruvate carboxykinase (ATP) [Candidatus Krumholzibacteriota bacterium]|nr:phosphoenolpyruvate carboxykinase (ATP) [Candidatus Krumholzibacteriota bacterium]
MEDMEFTPKVGLDAVGLENLGAVMWNPSPAELYEEAVLNDEAVIADNGPLVTETGKYTGRSPNDKFTVEEPSSKEKIWWGSVNRTFDEEKFDRLLGRVQAYLQGQLVYVQDCWVGADVEHRLPIRVVTEQAWHSLFARNMFLPIEDPEEQRNHEPRFTVINACGFEADPERDGTNSEAFIICHYGRGIIIIGGTSYAGEIKKSIFTVMNYLLPQNGVMAMHCSANEGPEGDVAVFFGLSGTGKTTLSADPGRALIGDDEHGWSDSGVFNFEGGCYAKVIRLSAEAEPEIFETTRNFGTVLENVVIDDITRQIDLDDSSLTENTRASYPIDQIPNAKLDGRGGHPKNIVMLTCDAFGVLPPVSKLSPEQASYHFLSGYTAKVAGTERGVTEPSATFSTCFGAPFMALPPTVYSELLAKKIRDHGSSCWLVNTGWSGGGYGVGERLKIDYSRAMVNAALEGKLDGVEYVRDPVFGLDVPQTCPDVPSEILNPRDTWKDKGAYDAKAQELARMFEENFQQFEAEVPADVKQAGMAG